MLFAVVSMLILPGNYACAETLRYKRTVASYKVPDVTLVDQNGKKVRFKSLVESDRPVVIDFIFGTCTTICPVLSAGYVGLQNRLGADSTRVRLVSISIDPENDTPKVMKEYLKRYNARTGWDFLTGSRQDIDTVMRAFNAYIPNKMSHFPLNLIRMPSDGTWVRLFGLMGSSEFLSECQQAGLK
jgi:protein SCO1/2